MTTIPSVTSLATSLGEFPPEAIIFGHSEVMQSLRDRMDKVASANVPVLIQGESGTGKDIIARMIHGLSPWRSGPFVKVNCPAIPGTLLESELFGYEKGAFTGAYGAKPGRVEMAHRGTLFLDEISELDLGLQSKLLQLLQDGQFCRIGAQEDKKVEVRVVCATNRVLEAEIESGTFRQDLFYRINVVNLQMPPLRERKGDIPDLVTFFLEYYNRKYNCRARTLSGDLMSAIETSLAGQHSRTGKSDQALRDSGQRGSHQQRPGGAPAGISHARPEFRWADRAKNDYTPSYA
jgi:two-component system response regulator AtoC